MASAIHRLAESPSRFMHVVPRRVPVAILRIDRYLVKPGMDSAVRNLHRQLAITWSEASTPWPSMAIESLTGPKEIWRLSGFYSQRECDQKAQKLAAEPALSVELDRIESQIRALTGSPSTLEAHYEAGRDGSRPWLLGRGHFLVVSSGRGEGEVGVYQTSGADCFRISATRTRRDADIRAAAVEEAEAQIFAIRPMLSVPSADWALRDPDFWGSSPLTRRLSTLNLSGR